MAGERVEDTRAVNARSRAQSQRGNLRCSSSRPPIPPRPAFHSRIRSTSLNVISSFVRSYSFVVRGDSCPGSNRANPSNYIILEYGDCRDLKPISRSYATPPTTVLY